MGLFYVSPHVQFDLLELDSDIGMAFFVIADTTRNAARFWMQKFNTVTGIEVEYAGAANRDWVAEMAAHDRAKHVVEIRDLSFGSDMPHGAVPWENIPPAYFQIAEA